MFKNEKKKKQTFGFLESKKPFKLLTFLKPLTESSLTMIILL
jgi:hypothetical protein